MPNFHMIKGLWLLPMEIYAKIEKISLSGLLNNKSKLKYTEAIAAKTSKPSNSAKTTKTSPFA